MQEEEQQQEQQQQGQEQEQQQQQPLKPRNRPLPTLPSWKPSRLPIKSPSTAFQLSSDTTGSTTLASSSSSTTLVPTPPSPLSSAPSVSSTPIQNEFNERASIKKSPSPNNVYTAAELNRIEDIFACLEDLNDSSSSGSEDSEELIQYLKELRSLTSTYQNVRKFLYTKFDKISTLLNITLKNRMVLDILTIACEILWNIAADFNDKTVFIQNEILLGTLIEIIDIPNLKSDAVDTILGFLATLSADKTTCKVLVDKKVLPKTISTFLNRKDTVPTIAQSSIKLFYNVIATDPAASIDAIVKNKTLLAEVVNTITAFPTSEPIVYYGCALLTLILQRVEPPVAQEVFREKEASFTKSLGIMLDTFVKSEHSTRSTPLAVLGLISVLAIKVISLLNAFFIEKIHKKIFVVFKEAVEEDQKNEDFVFFGLAALCGMCYNIFECQIALVNKKDIKILMSFLKLFGNDREIICNTMTLLLMISSMDYARTLIMNDRGNCVALLLNIVDRYSDYDQEMTNSAIALIEKLLETNSSITELNLSDIGMKDKSATILFRSLEHNNSIQTLDIGSNDITDTSAVYLLSILHTNTTIINLSMESNKISSSIYFGIKDFIRRNYFKIASSDWGARIFLTNQRNFSSASVSFISEFISRKATGNKVLTLDLSNNDMTYSEICALSAGLIANCSILKLSIGYNTIKDEGAKVCADVIRKNTSITSLDLTSGGITDVGVKHIADALTVNTTIRNLDLSKNPIKEEGYKLLSEALKRNRTIIQMGLDPELLKTSRTGKAISKQLKDNRGKTAKSALSSLFSRGEAEDVLWTLCATDLCCWLEDLGCTQKTLEYITDNNIDGEVFFTTNQRDLFEGVICPDDLQKIFSALSSSGDVASVSTASQTALPRTQSGPIPSENSINSESGLGLGFGNSDGSSSGYNHGSSGYSGSGIGGGSGCSSSEGSALGASDDWTGMSGYGSELRGMLLPLVGDENISEELPEIEAVLNECDAFVQSEVMKNAATLKFIADAKLSKTEVFLLSLFRANCVVLNSARRKRTFRDYVTSKENDVSDPSDESKLVSMMHDSVVKLQRVRGVVYIPFCEDIDRQNTFDEGRLIQLKKTLWATPSLESAKAAVTFPRIIIKAQVTRANDFTPFSGETPSDGRTVVIPHSARFSVARGLYLEQDGFSYIDLVETTQDSLNKIIGK